MAAAPGHRPSDPARKGVHAYLRYSALGLQMAGIILLSIWAGRWLDGRVDTGFPAFTALAMVTVPASHGGVVLGILPLGTAVAAALVSGERPSIGFWLVGVIGLTYVELSIQTAAPAYYGPMFASGFVMNTAFAADAFRVGRAARRA